MCGSATCLHGEDLTSLPVPAGSWTWAAAARSHGAGIHQAQQHTAQCDGKCSPAASLALCAVGHNQAAHKSLGLGPSHMSSGLLTLTRPPHQVGADAAVPHSPVSYEAGEEDVC